MSNPVGCEKTRAKFIPLIGFLGIWLPDIISLTGKTSIRILSPWQSRPVSIIVDVPKDQDVVCVCSKGVRSSEAVRVLKDKGCASVKYLGGGSLMKLARKAILFSSRTIRV